MQPPLIRHVRYQDFIALTSKGARDLDGFRSSIDTLVRQMGTLEHHHVLIDLRHAVVPPLHEAVLVEASTYLRARGLGVLNRIAVVVDPHDELRTERVQVAERIATLLGMHLRGFPDYAEALDWLNDPL
jgi:hypothetical protein